MIWDNYTQSPSRSIVSVAGRLINRSSMTVFVHHVQSFLIGPHSLHVEQCSSPLTQTLVRLRCYILICLSEHSNQHVDEQNRHQNHIDAEQESSQYRIICMIKLIEHNAELVQCHHMHRYHPVEQVAEVVSVDVSCICRQTCRFVCFEDDVKCYERC